MDLMFWKSRFLQPESQVSLTLRNCADLSNSLDRSGLQFPLLYENNISSVSFLQGLLQGSSVLMNRKGLPKV